MVDYEGYGLSFANGREKGDAEGYARGTKELIARDTPGSVYPDGDQNILACPRCRSGEYLHNEDGNRNKYCGQCGQAISWKEPEGDSNEHIASIYMDSRGWKYKVMGGIGPNAFKARYQKPGANGWKGLAALPWRETAREAQADLDEYAQKKDWIKV